MASTSTDAAKRLAVHIHWMIRRDMPEVLDIERESFENPWFEEDFIRCLRQRNCIGMVAERAEVVTGFMIYELHKTKLHILNFAVAKQLRHREIGSQMIEKLRGKLSSQRRTEIHLETREANLPAQKFFSAMGFRATGLKRDFYDDSPEDAIEFIYQHESERLNSFASIMERIDMDTAEKKQATPEPAKDAASPTPTAPSFPLAEKVSPIYRDEAGKFHVRLLEQEGKNDPAAVRHKDKEGNVFWLRPLTPPASK